MGGLGHDEARTKYTRTLPNVNFIVVRVFFDKFSVRGVGLKGGWAEGGEGLENAITNDN